MVHKNTSIPVIVRHNIIETAGCRSIVFGRPIGFDFEAGDWIDISFGEEHLKGGRTYSLSSSPTEPNLVITFKDGISEIKRKLASLRTGDKLAITQYGNDYKFTLKPHQQVVLIAGGVGISPFRSMLKEIYDDNKSNQTSLIYMNKDTDFLFREEINSWQREIQNFKANYIVTEHMKNKDRNRLLIEGIGDINNSFYIAGPESMVESTEHLLIDNGVDIKDIKIDSFGGY